MVFFVPRNGILCVQNMLFSIHVHYYQCQHISLFCMWYAKLGWFSMICLYKAWQKKWHKNSNTWYARMSHSWKCSRTRMRHVQFTFRISNFFSHCSVIFIWCLFWKQTITRPKTTSYLHWKMCWISKWEPHNQNKINITKQSNVFNDIIYSEVKQENKKWMMKIKMFMNMIFMKLFEMSI